MLCFNKNLENLMSELQSKYNKDEILNKVAPCSLCCYTCAAKKDGIIA